MQKKKLKRRWQKLHDPTNGGLSRAAGAECWTIRASGWEGSFSQGQRPWCPRSVPALLLQGCLSVRRGSCPCTHRPVGLCLPHLLLLSLLTQPPVCPLTPSSLLFLTCPVHPDGSSPSSYSLPHALNPRKGLKDEQSSCANLNKHSIIPRPPQVFFFTGRSWSPSNPSPLGSALGGGDTFVQGAVLSTEVLRIGTQTGVPCREGRGFPARPSSAVSCVPNAGIITSN